MYLETTKYWKINRKPTDLTVSELYRGLTELKQNGTTSKEILGKLEKRGFVLRDRNGTYIINWGCVCIAGYGPNFPNCGEFDLESLYEVLENIRIHDAIGERCAFVAVVLGCIDSLEAYYGCSEDKEIRKLSKSFIDMTFKVINEKDNFYHWIAM